MSTETEQYYSRARGSGVGFKIFKYFFKSLALILIFGTTAFFQRSIHVLRCAVTVMNHILCTGGDATVDIIT